ncbi:PorP/SprF family type IX secretion system membrane protein [Marivirga salinae]|uniref:PorP/SprF family type IX secretion system membrane protein n=1 Tax=Marivirga salinarum TaxID=3059078 RepID=A0AA51NBZ0_9BACT|nr:PorP/SprF family type IX secretion system membrane protein [Marivirga sp. BDSF4-3]WMN12174.1 PorP/SprF family type IX secretion system membrane protein [Marivirga sp. BDSF4-3]
MKKAFITIFLGLMAGSLLGQNFMHSLYKYTPNRVNPAFASTDDYQSGTFIFRNQYTTEDIEFMTSYAEFNQPFFNEERRWSGLSVSLMNDQSNGIDIYSFNQISASYAINVPLSKYSEMSIGLNSNFQSKTLKTNQLTTGSQYVEYFGFDTSLPSGENQSVINKNYISFALGLHWQKLDRYGKSLFSASYALHNLNKPENSFYENSKNRSPFLSMLTASATIMENYQWHIKQDLLIRHEGPVTELITGPSFSYAIGNMRTESIKTMMRYSTANNFMLGAVYESENISIGGSYDLNILKNNISNNSTFEVMLSIKRLKRPKRKSNFRFNSEPSEDKENDDEEQKSDNTKNKKEEDTTENQIREDDEHEIETIKVNTSAGVVTYLPHELEDLSYDFHFDFDDINLSKEDEKYIREMTEILRQNDRVKVKLTGHTDGIGTEEYNMKLSYDRAKRIGMILYKNGVSKSKIKLVAKGESEPLSTNETKEGQAQNRRVQMQLVYE